MWYSGGGVVCGARCSGQCKFNDTAYHCTSRSDKQELYSSTQLNWIKDAFF